jgi:hypothetical protein
MEKVFAFLARILPDKQNLVIPILHEDALFFLTNRQERQEKSKKRDLII